VESCLGFDADVWRLVTGVSPSPDSSEGISKARDGAASHYISICAPSSTTRFGGMAKYSVALREFCESRM